MQYAFRSSQDVVTVWEKTCEVGGRIGGNVKNMPDIRHSGDGSPLESEA
jgi:hypothetical protein